MKRQSPERRLTLDARRFAADVERVCKSRGLTISIMCELAGVHEATVSRMKHHGRMCDAVSLVGMAAWAGLDANRYLVDREAVDLARRTTVNNNAAQEHAA